MPRRKCWGASRRRKRSGERRTGCGPGSSATAPWALYTDWKNVYVRPPNAAERMRGETGRTQFGRMCQKLGIRIIAASSPQAKGRIERSHGTHQDRLAGVRDYAAANRYLEEHYLDDHNRRFARRAASEVDYHRGRPSAHQLDEIFWLEEERVVSQDWVVRYNNRELQLERQSRHWAPAKSRVLVRENEAGEIAIHYRGQRLGFHERSVGASTGLSEERGAAPSLALPSPIRHSSPGANHPWRQTYKHMPTQAFSSAG